jgi:hypothetical protein
MTALTPPLPLTTYPLAPAAPPPADKRAVSTTPTPRKAPVWMYPALGLMALAVLAATGVAITEASGAGRTSVQATQSAGETAEQTYLRMTHERGVDRGDPEGTLRIGHQACRAIAAGGDERNGRRLAVGHLMFYSHLSPGAALRLVPAAATSGLCTQRR